MPFFLFLILLCRKMPFLLFLILLCRKMPFSSLPDTALQKNAFFFFIMRLFAAFFNSFERMGKQVDRCILVTSIMIQPENRLTLDW